MKFILLQGNEQEFKSNFEKRLEQLKAEGKQLLISLSTILSKVITYISFFYQTCIPYQFRFRSKYRCSKLKRHVCLSSVINSNFEQAPLRII